MRLGAGSRSRQCVGRLRATFLPRRFWVVIADAILALWMVLLVAVDMHPAGDDLPLYLFTASDYLKGAL